tara:strand:- start:252 stop:644 length:393 start_codon:yes stop_codon:yes gene_type:complete
MIRDKKTKTRIENLITNTTWAEKEKMGLKNFVQKLAQLSKNEREGWSYTRLSKPDKSHINGPSNAIEGYPIETQHQTMDECYSTEYHMYGGSNYWTNGVCETLTSATSMCHKNHACQWSCVSTQIQENTC